MGLAETANLAVRISLDDKLTGGLSKMSRNLSKFDGGIGRAAGGAKRLTGGLLKVGAVAAGAVAVGLAAAARTATDFDDAFAAVVKTTEGSAPQLQALNDQLHALATRIPVKYTDLAGIAAEAGALGVARKDIGGFTETVARLSAATQGLTTEAAAEAFGKFKNSLQLSEKDIERSASALIALGNAGASSEGDIIEIGKRFAGAGRVAGLTAAQVLGLSSAIASVGVQPEAAGGALSRLFNKINLFIGTGDSKLKAFAKTTGQTVAAFKKGFEKDALGSFEAFLKGLSTLSGPEQAKRLKEAGITNSRDIAAVQLLSKSYGEVKRQTDLATDAFKKNTALTEVSTKRFDTLKNKLSVLKNNFLEAGYDIAEGFLPALGRAADKLTKFLQNPENVKVLKGIGTDLGKALDSVDFDKLLGVAKGLAQALNPALQIVLKLGELIAKLPPELIGASGGLLLANKLSGGAISGGIGDIIGGLGSSLAKSLIASVPIFGSAFVQPVRVVNFPGVLGGGLEGLVEGAVTAGLGATVLTVGLTVGSIAALGLALVDSMTNHPGAGGALAKDANGNIKPGQVFTTQHGFGRPPNQTVGPTGAVSSQHPVGEHAAGSASPAEYKAIMSGFDKDAKQTTGAIATLKEKLHNVIAAEGRATRAGDTRHASALAAKEAQIRSQLSTANAKLTQIRNKKTQFVSHTNVNVVTSVSLTEVQRQARYSSRVARTTALSAS